MSETNLPPVIQEMLKPGFYPHPVKEPIKLIQTHVSFVLLTGDYAYKLKKAVNFGFLDYSTLELREHFCRQELEMNKRGAAEIYLQVLPITQGDNKFELAGSGEAVEYALKMCQFPQDNLLINLFQQGKLTEEMVEDLGRLVAQFHSKCPTNDYILSFGEVAQVRQAFDENYAQTAKYIGLAQTQEQFDATKEFTDNFFATKQEVLTSRIKNRKIRECHGDLHLGNICLWDGKILLFDCIEFNEPFRFVDVMYDVAYGVMNFFVGGHRDLANAYLNTYLEESGDWEGLQVLPLYVSRQAYVRAKITSFLLDDPSIPDADKEQAKFAATQYYKMACDCTKLGQGSLIMMSGVSGSGKSTVAKKIARQNNAIHIRSDAVRKHLAGVSLSEKGGEDLYTPEMTERTYSRLLELGILLASVGHSVILDAKYDRQSLRQPVITAATKNHLPLQILHCTAPEAVLRDRLNSRTSDISDATANLLTSQLANAESFTEEEKVFVKTLDTTQDLTAQLN
ncbi:AAA family ATPase [Aerosakkonemataceae cyanobacterium BLCC-F154]|uniref:gluconokinase n=1 Tax=Floridaenema fluviatile BLCC-F154 TaxID=3153640 RepID=A0ABV4YGD5_9CYAN